MRSSAGGIGWISRHGDDVCIMLDDGRGAVLAHRGAEQQPAASSTMVLHLVAYATSVAENRIDPEEQVPMADWESRHVAGYDGGRTVPPSRSSVFATTKTAPSTSSGVCDSPISPPS